jgi:hypothetical protein
MFFALREYEIAQSIPVISVYAPMIYTDPCVTLLMRADPLRGKLGGGWTLEIESFLGPVKWKWHQADT